MFSVNRSCESASTRRAPAATQRMRRYLLVAGRRPFGVFRACPHFDRPPGLRTFSIRRSTCSCGRRSSVGGLRRRTSQLRMLRSSALASRPSDDQARDGRRPRTDLSRPACRARPLGDFDFALARQQRHGAHFLQAHPHGIVGLVGPRASGPAEPRPFPVRSSSLSAVFLLRIDDFNRRCQTC